MEEPKDLPKSPTVVTADVIAELNKPSASDSLEVVLRIDPSDNPTVGDSPTIEQEGVNHPMEIDGKPIVEKGNPIEVEEVGVTVVNLVQEEAGIEEEERGHEEIKKKTDTSPQPMESTGDNANVQAPKNKTTIEKAQGDIEVEDGNPSVEKGNNINTEDNVLAEDVNFMPGEEVVNDFLNVLLEAAVDEEPRSGSQLASVAYEAVPLDVEYPAKKVATKPRTKNPVEQAKKKLDFTEKAKGVKAKDGKEKNVILPRRSPRKNPPTPPPPPKPLKKSGKKKTHVKSTPGDKGLKIVQSPGWLLFL